MPMPERKNGATTAEYGIDGEETDAIQAIPIDCNASPAAISRCPPIRSDQAPAIGAMKIGIAVHGRMRRPACRGE